MIARTDAHGSVVRLVDIAQSSIFEACAYLTRLVGRSVVNDDDFEVGHGLRERGRQRLGEVAALIKGRDDDANCGCVQCRACREATNLGPASTATRMTFAMAATSAGAMSEPVGKTSRRSATDSVTGSLLPTSG